MKVIKHTHTHRTELVIYNCVCVCVSTVTTPDNMLEQATGERGHFLENIICHVPVRSLPPQLPL